MPIRTETATLPFNDSSGNPVAGAFFVIREKLSHDARAAWLIASQKIPIRVVERDGQKLVEVLDEELMQAARRVLVAGGLLEIQGVEDPTGQPHTPARACEMDTHLTRQIVDALFERNTVKEPDPAQPAAEPPPPNSEAPSAA